MAVAKAPGKLHRKRFPARKVCSNNQENCFPDDLDESFNTGLLHGNLFRGSLKRNVRSKWGIVGNRKLKGNGADVSGWGSGDKNRQQIIGNTDLCKHRGKKQKKDLTKLCLKTKGKRKLYPEDIDKLSHREDIDKLSHSKHQRSEDKHENDADPERYEFVRKQQSCNNQDFEEIESYYEVGNITHLDHIVPTLHHCYDDDINYNGQSIYQSENFSTHKGTWQWQANKDQDGGMNTDIAQVTSCKSKLEMETLTMELTKEWNDCNNDSRSVASSSPPAKHVSTTCETHVMKEYCDEGYGALEDKDKGLKTYFVPNADAFLDDEMELPVQHLRISPNDENMWEDEIDVKKQMVDIPPCQPKRACFEL